MATWRVVALESISALALVLAHGFKVIFGAPWALKLEILEFTTILISFSF
jgi:hypothetical protein